MVKMDQNEYATSGLDIEAVEAGVCLRFSLKEAIDASILAGIAKSRTKIAPTRTELANEQDL